MNTAASPFLQLEDVHYTYRALPSLRQLSWRWLPGEQWACLGPNGAGKTTLAGLLCGQLRHGSGRIEKSPPLQSGGCSYVCFEQQQALCDRDNRLDDSEFRSDARDPGTTVAEFERWNKDQQLAFLINAYNAFTIDLILTEYPQVESIKDLGSFLQSPWKKRFFTLLGQERHLDELEHEMIRAKGVYDEPRIHVAVVCASIGCPALRDEAYVADRLDAQLEDSFKRFLSDRSRNRYNPQAGKLEVSKIFSWYKEDFDDGRFSSLNDMFARYANLLADAPANRQHIQQGNVPIDYLDYDWALNDVRG